MRNCDYEISPDLFRKTAEPPGDMDPAFSMWLEDLYSQLRDHPKGGPAREAFMAYSTLSVVLADPTYSLKPNFVVMRRAEHALAYVFLAKALAVLNGEDVSLLESFGWQMMDGALDGYGVELRPELTVALLRETSPDRLRLFRPEDF